MRKIKFRAWDKINKMMFKDVQVLDLRPEKNEVRVIPITKNFKHSGIISITHSVLMQFTGLKDKNGKEIYEGDILKLKKHTNLFIVEWLMGGWYFRHNKEDDWSIEVQRNIWYLMNDMIEIKGNIYKNPELLKG